MASSNANFKSRDDHRKQMELEEARKAGLAPAEVDEETGKEINPHIPQYMSTAPWYLNENKPTLKHQRNWKNSITGTKHWYERGAKTFQAEKYRKGACQNCGAMTHASKDCVERPRAKGARWTNTNIAPDEKIEEFELDYESKRDRWNGWDAAAYSRVVDTYEKADMLKKEMAKQRQLQGSGDEDEDKSDDEAKVDESEQVDFGQKVEKRVRTTGGGATGTVRNLRIREDTAKYLINLDVNSAHYDPKTRSMREDPNPEANPATKFYHGDNFIRHTGQTKEFQQLMVHAWDAFERGQDIHVQAVPSAAELLHKEFKEKKDKLKSSTKESIVAKYGSAAESAPGEDILPRQTEAYVEYDRAGRVIRGQERAVPRSKYEEDVLVNNHTKVWGSWWRDGVWGYACCHSAVKSSYCTGKSGIEAAQASAELMERNMQRKQAEPVDAKKWEKHAPPSWGTEAAEDLQLDEEKLKEALRKEDEWTRQTERDDRKRKYNVNFNVEVTPEEMEAYRLRRTRADDPMKAFLGKDDDD